MASYAELIQAAGDVALRNKVKVAVAVAAFAIEAEDVNTPDHGARIDWAKRAFADPDSESTRMLWRLLAEYRSATLAQITGVSDAQVQTAVDAAVALFTS